MAHRGDDLGDDFVADDLVALSDGGVDSDLNSDYDEEPGPQRVGDPHTVSVSAVSEKKRKRKEKLKERKAKVIENAPFFVILMANCLLEAKTP
jgi:hypothetical protein